MPRPNRYARKSGIGPVKVPKNSKLSAQEIIADADELSPAPGHPQPQHDWSKGNFVIYEMPPAAVEYCRRRDRAFFKARKLNAKK